MITIMMLQLRIVLDKGEDFIYEILKSTLKPANGLKRTEEDAYV